MRVGVFPIRPKAVLWLAIIAQGLLAVWITRPWITADSAIYLRLAEGISSGGYGTWTSAGFQPDILRPPGYPLLLSIMHDLIGLPIVAIAIIQVAALWAAIYLAERLLERFGVSPLPMLALAAIYPFPAIYSAPIMTEAWVSLALTAIAFLLILPGWRLWRYATVGVIAGAASMFRPDLLLLPVLLVGIVFALEYRRGAQVAKPIIRAVIPALAAAIVLAPYTMWNYAHFGSARPTPLAGALGNSLYIAVWQPVVGFKDINALYAGVVTPQAAASGLGREVRRLNRSFGAPELTAPWNPAAYPTPQMQILSERVFRRAAIERIRRLPGIYAKHVWQNAWRLWNSSEYPPAVPRAAVALLQLVSGLVFLAGIAGVFCTLVQPAGWRLPRAPAAVFLYVPGIHLWLHTEARYTAPVRPLLLMFAGSLLWWIYQRRTRTRSEEPLPA